MPADANVIVLQGWHGENQYDEARAAGAIYPGDLARIHTDGTMLVHNVAGGVADLYFPIEEHFLGKLISEAYASGDLVRYRKCLRNDRINARLKANVTTTIHSSLSSDGNGTLKLAVAGEFCVGYADTVVTGEVGVVKRVVLVVSPHTKPV